MEENGEQKIFWTIEKPPSGFNIYNWHSFKSKLSWRRKLLSNQ